VPLVPLIKKLKIPKRKKADYEPILKIKNGIFQFTIRELYIKGTGDTVLEAYELRPFS
jgi:hypothetical protein|tara:strand:- start:1113 stop:1286 length:174 start_codon:yes stop_codon:yes gene_type:complete